MPVTVSVVAGDGITSPAIRMNVQLPDSGTTVNVQGVYQGPSIGSNLQAIQPVIPFSGGMTSPGVPGSGSNSWIIELNASTGVIQVKSNTTATLPTPDAGNIVLMSQVIAAGQPAAINQQAGITFPCLGTVSPN